MCNGKSECMQTPYASSKMAVAMVKNNAEPIFDRKKKIIQTGVSPSPLSHCSPGRLCPDSVASPLSYVFRRKKKNVGTFDHKADANLSEASGKNFATELGERFCETAFCYHFEVT